MRIHFLLVQFGFFFLYCLRTPVFRLNTYCSKLCFLIGHWKFCSFLFITQLTSKQSERNSDDLGRFLGFLGDSDDKESACNVGDLGWRPGFNPWVGKIPWRRERLPTPLFWLGEFHGLYSPWGRKELDRTERLSLSHVLVCSSCYNKTS